MQGQPDLAQGQAKEILRTPEADLQVVDLVSAGFLSARSHNVELAQVALRRLRDATKGALTAWSRRSVAAVEGEIALAENRPQQAVASFVAAQAAYPQASGHEELALAYEALRDSQNASLHWEQLIETRGEILREGFPAFLPLAELQLARLQRKAGQLESARNHYESVLAQWQQSDDLPQKRQAISELKEIVDRSQGDKQ
jgi:tetratricopeptide (TPR) repeat protein